MRFGPVAVPVAIVAALFVIVGAEAGWFDGAAPEPGFIRPSREASKVAAGPIVTPKRVAVAADRSAAAKDDTPAVGRSVGRDPAPTAPVLGSGGASLDADGVASAGPQELLRQAREEAAKAKQDVVDVTRAALDAQHASDAEFARQLDEANARNTELKTGLEQAQAEAAGLKQRSAAPAGVADVDELRQKVAQADAAAKAAADALAQSRHSETKLTAELAGVRAESDRKVSAAAEASKDAAHTIAVRDATLKAQAADLARANDAVAAQREDAGRLAAEIAALRTRAASLRLALAVESGTTARVRNNAAGAQRREAALGRENADLRASAAAETERARTAAESAARTGASKVAATGEALARSEAAVHELQGRIAALDAAVASGRSAAVASSGSEDVVARLKGDLDGARRGEDTLRKENGVLQRQLAQAQASGKMLGEKLAALQVGSGLARPEPLVPKPGRDRRPRIGRSAEHQRLLDEVSTLQRKQMQGEIDALRREANDLGRSRSRRFQAEEQGVHILTVKPAVRASKEAIRDRQPARRRDAAFAWPPAPDDDSRATIAQARTMIRAGHLDQARRLLSQHGGAATTRALADSYNPLTNIDYGTIGVDSDADKATYLYQQAARMAKRDR